MKPCIIEHPTKKHTYLSNFENEIKWTSISKETKNLDILVWRSLKSCKESIKKHNIKGKIKIVALVNFKEGDLL